MMHSRSFALGLLMLFASRFFVLADEKDRKDLPQTKQLEKCPLGNVKQIHTLGGVFLAGQPNPDDLKLAKGKGLKTVINLREKGEIDWDEEAAIKSLGLEYVHLPFKSAETLTDDLFDRARKLLGDKSKHPVLLH